MTRAVEYANDEFAWSYTLFLGNCIHIFSNRFVEVDDVGRVTRANRNLVHVHIGCIEKIALFGNGQYSQCVWSGLCRNRCALKRIERDVDAWASADGGADFFANKQHGRFVAFAFAYDNRAIHI